ncbi:Fic family protein [Rubellimicrobium roseum]|uniref:Fic family protein n=1 Tax=Rubellimicrobium roseum TaxID=687525 RepID=UPI002483079F|nr:Fic family protein [Rubellimicrobium roseum]
MEGAHERLLDRVGRVRGQDQLLGQYKRDQNMIGGHRLDTARFIPAPLREAEAAMSDLERHINRERKAPTHALIDMALVNYQFETIHPFADGNGRLGRMLISLMAVTETVVDMPVLYMSPELEPRKDAYIDLMYQVSAKGTWIDWISFFLEVTTLSVTRTVRTIDRVLRLHVEYRARAMAASRSNKLLGVIDLIFDRPVVQARTIVERIGVTDAAARTLLRQLTELGILVESGSYHPAAWFARELIDIPRPDIESSGDLRRYSGSSSPDVRRAEAPAIAAPPRGQDPERTTAP